MFILFISLYGLEFVISIFKFKALDIGEDLSPKNAPDIIAPARIDVFKPIAFPIVIITTPIVDMLPTAVPSTYDIVDIIKKDKIF